MASFRVIGKDGSTVLWGGVMHPFLALRLDCDLGSLAALLIGIGALSLLAVHGF
jgi:hypothetical protein